MTFTFPYETIPKINGNPTVQQLDKVREQLCANAGSVPSTNGGGQLGHTGMLLHPHEYATLSATPWTAPVYPGQTPTLVGLQARQSEEEKLLHAAQLKEWETYNDLNNALRKLIISIFDDSCLEGIKQPYTAYNLSLIHI